MREFAIFLGFALAPLFWRLVRPFFARIETAIEQKLPDGRLKRLLLFRVGPEEPR
jgi:hypothetical protein